MQQIEATLLIWVYSRILKWHASCLELTWKGALSELVFVMTPVKVYVCICARMRPMFVMTPYLTILDQCL